MCPRLRSIFGLYTFYKLLFCNSKKKGDIEKYYGILKRHIPKLKNDRDFKADIQTSKSVNSVSDQRKQQKADKIKKEFKFWSAKGGHPDRGGNKEVFQKVAGTNFKLK